MRVPSAVRPTAALGVLVALLLAGCATEQPTEPPSGGGPPRLPSELQARAIAVRVDVAAGTVAPVSRPSASVAGAPGLSLALFGANEIGAVTSSFFRSAVGQFTPKKVRVRFDVALTNRSSVALLPPSFPSPPAGAQAVLLFPFSTTLTAGNGAVNESSDWDGGVVNFFNDASCSSSGKSDCYRWEGYPAPFAPGVTTAPRTVGFDVDPTVQSFIVYFVLAADLQIPGSITGTVTSPERGALGGVSVILAPADRVTVTDAQTGTYTITGVTPGSYTLALSGLPAYCASVPPRPVTVTAGGSITADFSVSCPRLAFTSYRDGHGEIYSMNADGTGQTRLTTTSGGTAWEPAWSPDGSKIAFSRIVGTSGDVFTIDPTGSGLVNLTNSGQETEPAWSPDGQRLAFTSARDDNTGDLGTEIYLMSADGTNQTRLTGQGVDDSEAAWSPDGSRIAFSAGQSDADQANQIYVMSSDGSGRVQLTTGSAPNTHPTWSPDGSRIAFASARDGHFEIYVMNADGSDQTRLTVTPGTAGAHSRDPAWSPDGTRIAFAQATSGPIDGYYPMDIYVMNPDGTGIVRLTTADGPDFWPSWER
jgi:Tol biopolymer transport system component